jgi:hypothetical protein
LTKYLSSLGKPLNTSFSRIISHDLGGELESLQGMNLSTMSG